MLCVACKKEELCLQHSSHLSSKWMLRRSISCCRWDTSLVATCMQMFLEAKHIHTVSTCSVHKLLTSVNIILSTLIVHFLPMKIWYCRWAALILRTLSHVLPVADSIFKFFFSGGSVLKEVNDWVYIELELPQWLCLLFYIKRNSSESGLFCERFEIKYFLF